MNAIKSFSYDGEKEAPIVEEFQKIAEREKIGFSDLVIKAMAEYVKKHGSGNDTYVLDQWKDPDFKATPAFLSDFTKWTEYLSKCNPAELKDNMWTAEHIAAKSREFLKR